MRFSYSSTCLQGILTLLTEQLEREPTTKELAAALEMEMAELSTFQSITQPRHLVSFDETNDHGSGEEGLMLAERLADPAMNRPDAPILNAEERRQMHQCLRKLPKTQATVITLHYFKGVALRDIAAMLKVTPSRVSQLHHQALGRLRLLLQRLQAAA
jgi:RNA polymerase sigma factor for flagellar operon FliA